MSIITTMMRNVDVDMTTMIITTIMRMRFSQAGVVRL
jgi:hypothetical protein